MGINRLEASADLKRSPGVLAQPLVQTPPSPHCEACVIVPVRNEAENLETTLTALAAQTDLKGQPLNPNCYEIVLLANNCSDDSAAIARSFARRHPIALHVVEKTLPPQEAYIGRVRQLLMDEAYRRLMLLGGRQRIIASTDGDTQVAPTWIAATLREISCGADAVGGRIITDRAGRNSLDPYARACHLREVGYRYLVTELETYLDPDPFDVWPRHYQHYGASLAVTAQMYQQAGGMQPVRTPEDEAFYRALVKVSARFRHSMHVQVATSARTTGRTNIGLANQLHQWATMGRQKQSFMVESAAEVKTRFQVRHRLRELWWRTLSGYQPTLKDIAPIANVLGISTSWLSYELTQLHTFGLLWQQVEQRQQEEGIWCQRWQKAKIEEAIAQLRLDLDALRQQQKCLQYQIQQSYQEYTKRSLMRVT